MLLEKILMSASIRTNLHTETLRGPKMSMPISSTGSYNATVTAPTTKPTSSVSEKLESPAMEAAESPSEKASELSTQKVL